MFQIVEHDNNSVVVSVIIFAFQSVLFVVIEARRYAFNWVFVHFTVYHRCAIVVGLLILSPRWLIAQNQLKYSVYLSWAIHPQGGIARSFCCFRINISFFHFISFVQFDSISKKNSKHFKAYDSKNGFAYWVGDVFAKKKKIIQRFNTTNIHNTWKKYFNHINETKNEHS